MDPSSRQNTRASLLVLLRLGIGNEAGEALPAAIDWPAVRALAKQQQLTAIAFDGAVRLLEAGTLTGARALPGQIKMQWLHNVDTNYEQRYPRYRRALADLTRFYAGHGIPLMVLKGYGLSLCYPRPEHRPCGDFDIWLSGRQQEADRLLTAELGIPVEPDPHHHTMFQFEGFSVENHFNFFNVRSHRSNRQLEDYFKRTFAEGARAVEVEGERVLLPGADFHAMFLLRHSLQHFAGGTGGFRLRNVLDWALFVRAHAGQIHWEPLLEVAAQYRMTPFLSCLDAICIQDLGFDAALFPALPVDAELKERVLQDILFPPFGDQPEPRKLLPRIAYKWRRLRASAWKDRLCFSDDQPWRRYLLSLWDHLIHPDRI